MVHVPKLHAPVALGARLADADSVQDGGVHRVLPLRLFHRLHSHQVSFAAGRRCEMTRSLLDVLELRESDGEIEVKRHFLVRQILSIVTKRGKGVSFSVKSCNTVNH